MFDLEGYYYNHNCISVAYETDVLSHSRDVGRGTAFMNVAAQTQTVGVFSHGTVHRKLIAVLKRKRYSLQK